MEKQAKTKAFGPAEFRKELNKLLPGFKWSVERRSPESRCMVANGIQSSGFNRTATMQVERERESGWYKVRASGYGKNVPWLGDGYGGTLARAVRLLQDECERRASMYGTMGNTIQDARSAKK